MRLRNSILLTLFLVFFSCSGIKPLAKEKQFSENFKNQIIQIKKEMVIKNYSRARQLLNSIDGKNLKPIELAEKYNILGLIEFGESKYDRAKSWFIKALSFDFNQPELINQIVLNIASAEYKLGNYPEAFNRLDSIEVDSLVQRDRKKRYILAYVMAKKLKREDEEFFALVGLLSSIKTKRDLVGNRYYKILSYKFDKLDSNKKLRLLSDFEKKTPSVVVAHFAYNLSMSFYKEGKDDDAKNLKEWILDNFPKYQANFNDVRKADIEVFQEIDTKKIGIILPLSGQKRDFGLRALDGITLALKKLGDPFTLVIRDSKNSVNAAATYARNLIVEEKVALIIGGLFSQTAQREFETAQKLGGIYISLSPIYLGSEKKDPLLIELPGSVESQVNAALSEAVASKLGKKVAIFYPDNNIGSAYLDEFWKLSDERHFEVITAGSYPADATDFRDPISNMVGLKYQRERKEEYELWESIYKAKYNSTDRIQILQPVVEFDWIFVPSFPQQAIQIIPSFRYVGVKKVPFMGGPSWRSRSIISRQGKLGKVFYIGDLIEEKKESFRKIYTAEYKSQPKLLETMGFDSIYLAKEVLQQGNWSDREELNRNFSERKSVNSFLSSWNRIGQSWIKLMNVSKITNRGIRRL